MNCPDSEHIEHYVCGKLSQSQLAELEAHLKDCSKCALKVADARKNESVLSELRALRTTSSSKKPPSHLWESPATKTWQSKFDL